MRNFLDHSRKVVFIEKQVPCFPWKLCALLKSLSTEPLHYERRWWHYWERDCKLQFYQQSDRKEDMS